MFFKLWEETRALEEPNIANLETQLTNNCASQWIAYNQWNLSIVNLSEKESQTRWVAKPVICEQIGVITRP